MTRPACVLAALLACTTLAAAPHPAPAAPALTPTPLCCVPNGAVSAVAVSGTTVYFGGDFRHVGRYTGRFAAIDPVSGQPAENAATVDDGFVTESVADGSGGAYIAGTFTSVAGAPRAGLAHIKGDGTLDPAWAPSTDGSVSALAVFGSRVFVGGHFTTVNGTDARADLAAFDRTTGAVSTFAADVAGRPNDGGEVTALEVTSNPLVAGESRLWIGGRFISVGGQPRVGLALYDLDAGAIDPDFRPDDLNGVGVLTLLVRDVEPGPAVTLRVFAGGAFTAVGATPRNRIAVFDGTSGALLAPDPGPASGSITALTAAGANVYAAGDAEQSGSDPTLLAFDRISGAVVPWRPQVLGGDVKALAAIGSTIYLGGTLFSAGFGVPRTGLAAVDATTGVATAWDPEATGVVFTLSAGGGRVLAGGSFVTVGGTPRHGLAAIDLRDGQLTALNPDIGGAVGDLVVAGSTLYVGGSFDTVNGSTIRRNLAALDLTSGAATAFDAGLDGPVSALAVHDGTVDVAGSFHTVGGSLPRDGVASFDAATGVATTFAPAVSSRPVALAASGGTLFAAGGFTQVNGSVRRGAAALRPVAGTTGLLEAFDPDFDKPVTALAPAGPTVYAGGFFNSVHGGTTPRNALAALDATSGLPTAWNPDVSGVVRALALTDGLVIAGGQFDGVHGSAVPNLAAVDPVSGAPTEWAPRPDDAVTDLAVGPAAGLVVGGAFGRLSGSPATGHLAVFALAPAAPAAPTATGGDGQATVAFAAPADGGAPIGSYTVTAAPGGQTATVAGSPAVISGLSNGTSYTFSVQATNSSGTGPPSPASNAVTPSAAPPSGPGPGPLHAADRRAPVISALKLTRRRFAVGRNRTAATARAKRTARAKQGTTISFRLSERATTAITIERVLPGRRKGSRCVAPRKGLRRRCDRHLAQFVLRRAKTAAGANKVSFSGRVGRRALHPGRHRVTVVATDRAGNRSRPARVTFTVVRR